MDACAAPPIPGQEDETPLCVARIGVPDRVAPLGEAEAQSVADGPEPADAGSLEEATARERARSVDSPRGREDVGRGTRGQRGGGADAGRARKALPDACSSSTSVQGVRALQGDAPPPTELVSRARPMSRSCS